MRFLTDKKKKKIDEICSVNLFSSKSLQSNFLDGIMVLTRLKKNTLSLSFSLSLSVRAEIISVSLHKSCVRVRSVEGLLLRSASSFVSVVNGLTRGIKRSADSLASSLRDGGESISSLKSALVWVTLEIHCRPIVVFSCLHRCVIVLNEQNGAQNYELNILV